MKTKYQIENIEISNPNKVIFPNSNIKKIDVIKYYQAIAPYMLPFLNNRILSVIRCHNGECFYNKHPQNSSKYITTCKIDKEKEEYFYVNTKQNLLYQVQLGSIEFHTWGSSIKNINKPNLMVFDLDPDENLPIKNLRQGVKDLKSVLDELGLTSFLKTSGGKGYHIVVPFVECSSWEKFNDFAKKIVNVMEQKWSNQYTSSLKKSDRKNKIFIDYMRNTKGATCVAPYSLRARKNAPISFPIQWSNLNKIKPNGITLKNHAKYLQSNLWQDFFKIKQKIK